MFYRSKNALMNDESATPLQAEDIAPAIEALLLDDDGIGKIEANLDGFNIFEAIGHTRSELRNSDFLAFLLDPNETHGLGAEFLTRFVVEVVKAMRSESRPLSLSEIALMDLEGCVVRREHLLGENRRVDVFCIDEERRFLLAIENKVDSGEGPDQLEQYRSFLEERYRDFRRVLAYLTPDSEAPSDESWARVGYGQILSIIEALAGKHRESLGDAVAMTLDHYARMLRRNIVTDDHLTDTARAVYRKHKTALDFIFEHRPDDQLEISEFAAKLASNDSRIEVVRPTKTYIRFFPNAWKDISVFNATPTDEWTRTGHSLLFEIRNTTSFIKMVLVIGPTKEEKLRRGFLDFSHKNPKLFPGASKSLFPKYTQIYSKAMIDQVTLDRQAIKDIECELEGWFHKFMDQEFEGIVDGLAVAFAEARAD